MVLRARPNVVDSSAWLAYFAEEPSAAEFAAAIEDTRRLVVPAVCVLEVLKVVARQRGEGAALQAAAVMQQGQVVDLDAGLALTAAALGLAHKLPRADSVVDAAARAVGGVVWTQGDDCEGLSDAQDVPRRRAKWAACRAAIRRGAGADNRSQPSVSVLAGARPRLQLGFGGGAIPRRTQ